MPTGTDPGPSGPTPRITEGGPNYNTNIGSTQGRNRSLGFKRINTRPAEKGL